MKERELWELTVEALQSFYDVSRQDPTVSPEDVAEEVTGLCLTASLAEASFVRECVVGVTHFEKLCEGALQGYCNYHKRNRADRLSMYLIAYITYFRYDELGAPKVRELIYRCTSTPRLAEYVAYLVDASAIRLTALPLWQATYDDSFLERTVLGPIAQIATDARANVVEWLRAKGTGGPAVAAEETSFSSQTPAPDASAAHGGSAAKKKRKLTTTSKAPRLHSTNTQRLPPADVRAMVYTIPEPRPAPPKVAPATDASQQQAKPLTEPVGFSFHHRIASRAPATGPAANSAPPPTEVTPSVPRQSERRLRAILDKDVESRMTHAAILREAHTYRKEEEAQERALADKEFNTLDTFSYEMWRDEQRQEEAHQRELQVLEHHLDALKSRERVAEMREETQRQKRAEQRLMKREQEKEKARLQREKKEEIKAQRGFVSSLRREMEKNRVSAQRACVEEKMKTADEVRAQNERLAEEARKVAEQERVEQALTIEEIRQLRVRIRAKQEELREQRLEQQQKPTCTSPSPGVAPEKSALSGMSLLECRQELARLREEDAQLEEEKRACIVKQRTEAKQQRQQLEQQLQEGRERRRMARELTNEKRQSERQLVRQTQLQSENERMLALHERLTQKRDERQREWSKSRNEERQLKNDLLLLAQDHTAVEQKRWLQQEKGATNRIAAEQRYLLADKQRHC